MSETRLSPYAQGLEKTVANYVPLTPLTFIERSAYVYPERVAVIHGARRYTWRESYVRCRRLASALKQLGIGKGDTVAAILNNTPEMFECHFGVPACGAVLNTINTRLDAEAVAFILNHAEARVLITDREYSRMVKKAVELAGRADLVVIDVDDPEYTGPGECLGRMNYEALIAGGSADFVFEQPADEWDAISLNYTSGTTGNPKGVVYHHRGAYLNAMSNIVSWGMPPHAVYLWTLPMFHCNGWCFAWTMAANAGVNVCLRRVDPRLIFDAIREHGVTHYCGAPIVHSMLANAPEEWRKGINHKVSGLVAAAPPPAAVIEGMAKIGFDITHVYGLTETYGPAAVCAKHDEWRELPLAEQVSLNGRQGVRYHAQEGITVMDPATMEPVPWDGETMGEIMFRGNLVMKGYLKNPDATAESFRGGWYHTGDLAVMQPDGYVKIKDRSKDIIISGGENISSIEVEDALYKHPAVMAAAVVALPDDKWGEVPCAFVELREGAEVAADTLVAHCREHLAGFKVPKRIIFGELPKTSTGKIQKFVLRDQARSTASFG
ncbi:acyl-CoA synthetase [Thauera mechernichensis]|uniref:Acyl-CoA synthetase n=1 Tax=Thauera mechernichensis TaxID=82788 RepID=A0ABW3WC63_9RHOO|nr:MULTISPECIES: acyl-CoA synthetase [Thauera]HNR59780.1 acyl-CoA synthetase [Thauera sp.]ENO82166.1 acyl-CoA synthetase [Thauera sp. 27]MDG3065325.1 acyl-CoA synthetase [Thauera mechernichensis]HNS92243.1 acyl-CoA synthetase [Thauera sp.]HRK09468.1 acyl-CoA synthetase [Thauera sp.]